MNSLPTELNLKILHHFRDSDPDAPFAGHSGFSIAHGEEYNAFLLRMALYHRHWTALAQAELFHYILLKDADKTRLLLKLLKKRGNGVFRTYAEKTPIIRLGYYNDRHEWDDLKDHLEKLAEYCPNIAEIWCTSVNTKLSDFQHFRRLDRLYFVYGIQDGSGSFSLSVTELTLAYCKLRNYLNPASFPFLRQLSCAHLPNLSVEFTLPLLPQITSLIMMPVTSTSTTNRMLPASISLTSLSLADYNFDSLDKGSHNIIKERLEVIRIRLGSLGCDLSKLVECITGGKVLKKVILDEVSGEDGSHEVDMKAELKKVVDACKKKKTVELWKENFTVRRILLSTAKLI